ncbi:DBH-like monooxygenase protein 2 [Pleurodeles waltl]|uniref:DBH-like monooxygenase protein 2 n=1 Tax=Pleurodeles waltl TaxID=8319 RepID=UPI0037097B40
MQVIATLLHSHLAGRAIQVGHYRDGKQIGFVGRDMSYDFSLQETRYLAAITPIKVGDELQTECTYNTTERSSVTYGGLSTTSEMCLAFMFYTPRNLIAECTSNPDYRSLSSAFGFDVHSNPAALNLVSWTPENISLAQRVTQESTQNIRVIHFNASFIQDTGLIRDIIPPPVTPCNSSEPSTTAPTSMPNMPNTVPHCHSGQSLSSGYLCLTLFLLSTLSVILSPFLDF